MGKYTDKIKCSIILLIFVASCSSAPLKSSNPLPSHAVSNLSSFPPVKSRTLEGPGLVPELCSLAVSEKPTLTESKATQETSSPNKMHSHLPKLKFPVPSGTLSSAFGYRRGIFHTGLDIKAPQGEDVLACADGRVVSAGTRKGYRSYGRMVLIDHGRDVSTLYAHLSGIHVTAGQKIVQGQKIACVGSRVGLLLRICILRSEWVTERLTHMRVFPDPNLEELKWPKGLAALHWGR